MVNYGKSFTLINEIDQSSLGFIWIPSGRFLMGINENHKDYDEFAHQFPVHLTKGFWLGQYLVTQSSWNLNPKRIYVDSLQDKIIKDVPIFGIGWNEAIQYCQQLNYQYQEILPKGYMFSLPTEAQWEYACRANTIFPHCTSPEGKSLNDVAMAYSSIEFMRNGILPPKVGQALPNSWGLYDMLGSVEEWCFDVATEYPRTPSQDWVGNKETYWIGDAPEYDLIAISRMIRGSFSAYYREYANFQNSTKVPIGFRVCLRPVTEYDFNDPLLLKEGLAIRSSPPTGSRLP